MSVSDGFGIRDDHCNCVHIASAVGGYSRVLLLDDVGYCIYRSDVSIGESCAVRVRACVVFFLLSVCNLYFLFLFHNMNRYKLENFSMDFLLDSSSC